MQYYLKIDYDTPFVVNKWRNVVNRVYRVYYDKRTYLPFIMIKSAKRTKKGVHLLVDFEDNENEVLNKTIKSLLLINLQSVFESDLTRSLFDQLRVQRGITRINLMFSYKSGRKEKKDSVLAKKLQSIVDKTHEHYLNRKSKLI